MPRPGPGPRQVAGAPAPSRASRTAGHAAVWQLAALLALAGGCATGSRVPLAQQLALCAACHGADGAPTAPRYPVIAGQPAAYAIARLRAYRAGSAADPEMAAVVRGLRDADLRRLAEYYAARPPGRAAAPVDPGRVEAGRQRAAALNCARCHLGDYAGIGAIPRLAGQAPAYLLGQMRAFRDGSRPDPDGVMRELFRPLDDADLEALAHYLASLP